jgi:hypothetical protein
MAKRAVVRIDWAHNMLLVNPNCYHAQTLKLTYRFATDTDRAHQAVGSIICRMQTCRAIVGSSGACIADGGACSEREGDVKLGTKSARPSVCIAICFDLAPDNRLVSPSAQSATANIRSTSETLDEPETAHTS